MIVIYFSVSRYITRVQNSGTKNSIQMILVSLRLYPKIKRLMDTFFTCYERNAIHNEKHFERKIQLPKFQVDGMMCLVDE